MTLSRQQTSIELTIAAVLIGVALLLYLDDSAPPSHPESDARLIAHPLVD